MAYLYAIIGFISPLRKTMSYIDTLNHSYVGNFCELPVYHLLQDTVNGFEPEFIATSNNLVIGGGSGEHPAMVVQNLDVCVWDFLEFIANQSHTEISDTKIYDVWFDNLSPENLEQYNANLKYSNWTMQSITNFSNIVNAQYAKATQYMISAEDAVETKISIMLGEFIYYSGRHLLSEDLQNLLGSEAFKNEMMEREIYPSAYFISVQVSPEGYPVGLGKYMSVDDNGEIKMNFGLRFSDEFLLDRELNKNIKNELVIS